MLGELSWDPAVLCQVNVNGRSSQNCEQLLGFYLSQTVNCLKVKSQRIDMMLLRMAVFTLFQILQLKVEMYVGCMKSLGGRL